MYRACGRRQEGDRVAHLLGRAQPPHRHQLRQLSRSSPYWRIPSVSIQPGATQTTPMSYRPHSTDSTRATASVPDRAADECTIPGMPRVGHSTTETMRPPPCSIIQRFATCWVRYQGASRLSRRTAAQPLGVMSSAGAMNWPPALLTSTSIAAEPLQREVDQRVRHLRLADVARQRRRSRRRSAPASAPAAPAGAPPAPACSRRGAAPAPPPGRCRCRRR